MLNYFLFPLSIAEAQVVACVNPEPFSLLFYAFSICSAMFFCAEICYLCKTGHVFEMHVATLCRLSPWSTFGSSALSQSDVWQSTHEKMSSTPCFQISALQRIPKSNRNSAENDCFAFSACPDGFFGLDCHQVCKCKNAAGCDHILGTCRCLPGWLGETCEQRTYRPCSPFSVTNPPSSTMGFFWDCRMTYQGTILDKSCSFPEMPGKGTIFGCCVNNQLHFFF